MSERKGKEEERKSEESEMQSGLYGMVETGRSKKGAEWSRGTEVV